jgi:tetratricopeptide (TPR) repeat protein
MPPPPAQPIAAPIVPADEVSTAKAPPVVHAREPEERAVEERAPVSRPLSASPQPDLDEGFFDHGERAAADAHREASDLENYDEKMAQKNSPEARARRAKNWRYVVIAGAACVLLLLVADVKNRWAHGDSPAVEPPLAVNVAPPPPSAAPKVEPAPIPVVVPPASSAEDQAAAGPAASGSAQAVVGGAPSGAAADSKGWVASPASATAPAGAAPLAAAAADPTADDKKSAAQEKRTAQSFLDQGAFAKAVAAGEQSVALDPGDGEAWLLLGAAYQSMGKGAEARRTFTSCVAEGKRGPVNECRAMLR